MACDDRRYRTEAAPRCPAHGIVMLVYSSHANVRYCKCPITECSCTAKQARRDVRLTDAIKRSPLNR